MRFTGSDWDYVGNPGFTSYGSSYFSFAEDDGELWVAYLHNFNIITVMRYTENGWVTVGTEDKNGNAPIHLAVEDNTPYVVFRDYSNNSKTSAMKLENGNWVRLGEAGFSDGSYEASHGIAVHNGVPYVTAWGNDAKATVYQYKESGWEYLGEPNFSEGQATYLFIKISQNGTPYVAFKDAGDLNKPILMRYSGIAWEKVGDEISSSQGPNTSVAFNSNGTPYVAFKDYTKIRRASVMKFGTATGTPIRLTEKNDFGIYPNPNQGVFTLELSEKETNPFHVEITDVSGKIVYSETFEFGGKQSVELPHKEKGLYLVKIESGDSRFTKSVLISN